MANVKWQDVVPSRRGHFQLESGYHGGLWLDLDGLFSKPGRIDPLVDRLAQALRPHDVTSICGPLLGGAFLAQLLARLLNVEFLFTERRTPAAHKGPPYTAHEGPLYGLFKARYILPPALVPRVHGARVAIVDDVMSAGSALRGTYDELRAHGAVPVVAGALLVLGTTGADFFAQQGVAVEAVDREPYDLWLPAACPRCAAGEPLVACTLDI